MRKVIESLKKDATRLAAVYAVMLVAFKIAFYNEDLLVLIRVVSSFFWLFIIPGYFLTRSMEMRFIQRIVVGSTIAAAIMGILSYYLGLLGFHIKYHGIVLPIIILCASIMYSIIHNKRANHEKTRT